MHYDRSGARLSKKSYGKCTFSQLHHEQQIQVVFPLNRNGHANLPLSLHIDPDRIG